MDLDFDVIIVGGGPAGALTAAIVRRDNPDRRVLVLERERFPRHHVGEVTIPGWAAVLRRAGVLEKLEAQIPIKKIGVVFTWGPPEAGDSWTADFREGEDARPIPGSWHVERATFDAMLLDHAGAVGADVRTGAQVTAVVPSPRLDRAPRDGDRVDFFDVTWTEDGRRRQARSRFVVDASGQARFLARHWRVPIHRHPDMNNHAVYGYFTGSRIHETGWSQRDDERWTLIASCDFGWLWHIPIRPDVTSVGLVTNKETIARAGRKDLRALYDDAIASCPNVARLLEPARFVGSLPDGSAPDAVQTVSDWSYHSEKLSGPGWFQVGDTALFVDPILSSGLTLVSQGALMAANALTTIWREPGVDEALLRDSFERRYRSVGDLYHRMARVWYLRNVRATTWHWHAHQALLRAGGGEAVYERTCDAFTAVCLGAVADPLANAVRHRADTLHASEFFTWVTSRNLFGEQVTRRAGGLANADDAREEARRGFLERWRRLALARVRLRPGKVATREGFHTSAQTDRWHRIRYLEVELPDREGTTMRLAFPALSPRAEGVLGRLDGSRPTIEVAREALAHLPIGGDERAAQAVALIEMFVQLDMMEHLEVVSSSAPVEVDGHPLLTVLFDAARRAAGHGAEITGEVDWLGEQCLLGVELEGRLRRFRLGDVSRCDRRRFGHFSTTTAATHLERAPDAATERFLRDVIGFIVEHERTGDEAHRMWPSCVPLAAMELRCAPRAR